MKVLFRGTIIFIAALAVTAAVSAQTPTLEGSMAAQKIVKDRDDREVAVPADKVEPRDIVEYTIEYRNTGSMPASGVNFVGPVPSGTTYIEDSAYQSEEIIPYFSIDGGETYQEAPVTYVVNEGTENEQVKKADPGMITHIRWEMKNSLKASGSVKTAYRVRIK